MSAITATTTRRVDTAWPAFAAAAWAVVFGAFHCYWALGGRFGLGTLYDEAFRHLWFLIGDLVVAALCAVGAVLSLATVRIWGHRVPRWLLTGAMWTAAVLLVERGGIAVVMDIAGAQRLPAGLATPLNEWSSIGVDCYFCLGGLFFALAAWTHLRRTGRYGFAIAGAVLGSAGIGALLLHG